MCVCVCASEGRSIHRGFGGYFLNFVLIKVKGDKMDDKREQTTHELLQKQHCLLLFTFMTSSMFYCLVDII